jgi:hypothetical protein
MLLPVRFTGEHSRFLFTPEMNTSFHVKFSNKFQSQHLRGEDDTMQVNIKRNILTWLTRV